MTGHETAHDAPAAAMASPDPVLVYDGACPLCSAWVAVSRFETRAGQPLRLVDAREAPGLVARCGRDGCDLDEGMLLVLDGRRYHGAAAMTALAPMATGAGRFGRLARWLASSPARARRLYPWLRRLRGVALRLGGTPRLRG